MSRALKYILYTLVLLFALIGLLFTFVFVGMRFGVFNIRGSSIERNAFFSSFVNQQAAVSTAHDISCLSGTDTCSWEETREWLTVQGGLQKDAAVLARVSGETGVPSALIAAVVVPEQIRFFTSEREVFKRYFEPLKLLGSLSQFSLGVSGIKQETAKQVEMYAYDANSPLYPGAGYAELLSYPTGVERDQALYDRLTDPENHYYSYLYTALYIKEVQAQWSRAGYPIDARPDIVATLFNIGFDNSLPKPNPVVAGAPITVGGTTYSFGELAGLVYRSGALNNLGN